MSTDTKRSDATKKAVVNMTSEQYRHIKAAADSIGVTVPTLLRLKALEFAAWHQDVAPQ